MEPLTTPKVLPQTLADCSQAFLGIKLNSEHKYLIVNNINGKFNVISVSESFFEDIPEQNLIQGRQFQSIILKARSNNYKIKALNEFKTYETIKINSNSDIEDNSDIINSIFFDRIRPLVNGDERFYRNAFANLMEWHMHNYFFLPQATKQEVLHVEEKKHRTSSSRGRPKFSIQIPDCVEHSPPKKHSPRILKISPRQEILIKNLGKEGIELCRYFWKFHLLKIPEDPSWKEKISLGEYERIEKSGILKTPLMNFLLQEQISRMINPAFNKHSLASDIKRNLGHIAVFEGEEILKVCTCLPNKDFEFEVKRFETFLKILLGKIEAPNDVSNKVLLHWHELAQKEDTNPDFSSIAEEFISKLGANQYENKLFMLLVVMTQQTYIFPTLTLKEILHGIPIKIKNETKQLKYQFLPGGNTEFHSSIFVYPSKEFSCPYFEIEVINVLRLTDKEVWNSEIEFRIHLDKSVEKKQLDHLFLESLYKFGLNVSINWKISTTKIYTKLQSTPCET